MAFFNGIKEFYRASIERQRKKNELIILQAGTPGVPFVERCNEKVLESRKGNGPPAVDYTSRVCNTHVIKIAIDYNRKNIDIAWSPWCRWTKNTPNLLLIIKLRRRILTRRCDTEIGASLFIYYLDIRCCGHDSILFRCNGINDLGLKLKC